MGLRTSAGAGEGGEVKGVLGPLYLDPVLSRSCPNTPLNHNYHLKSNNCNHNQLKTDLRRIYT